MLREIALFGLPCIGVVGLIACKWGEALLDKLVYKDDGTGRRLMDHFDAFDSYHSASAQLQVREVFARMRREASDAVGLDPVNWFAHLIKAKADAFDNMKAIDPSLCQALGQMIQPLSYGQILYPEEVALVDRLVMKHYDPTNDMRAALRIY